MHSDPSSYERAVLLGGAALVGFFILSALPKPDVTGHRFWALCVCVADGLLAYCRTRNAVAFALLLIIPLGLIWYADLVGALRGNVGHGGGVITVETPGWMVAGFGWIVLFAVSGLILHDAFWLDTASGTAPPTGPSPIAASKDSDNYSKRILGRWLGPRKFRIFHADGTWAIQRNEEAPQEINGRRWHIDGNKLTLTYPGDHGIENGVWTIVSFTPKEFILEADGYKEKYERAP